MSEPSSMRKLGLRLRETHAAQDRQRLFERLCLHHRLTAQSVAQLTHHAERMYYPQFRDRLLQIAAEERNQLAWFTDQILALGGEVPVATEPPETGKNNWDCLRLDLAHTHASYRELARSIHLAALVDPDLSNHLGRIRLQVQRQCEEIRNLFMQSEPDAPPGLPPHAEQLDVQKQRWLAEQKAAWFARQRASWEASGKTPPWAEWVRDQEKLWTINTLPNLELIWTRRLAELPRQKSTS